MHDPQPFGAPFPATAAHEDAGGGFGPAPSKAKPASKKAPVQTPQVDAPEAPNTEPADA